MSLEKLPEEMKKVKDYPYCYWSSAEKDGYSGVGLLSKTKPLSVKYGFDDDEDDHNKEGRLITAEFESFFVVTTYVPNAGRGINIMTDPKFDKTTLTADWMFD